MGDHVQMNILEPFNRNSTRVPSWLGRVYRYSIYIDFTHVLTAR